MLPQAGRPAVPRTCAGYLRLGHLTALRHAAPDAFEFRGLEARVERADALEDRRVRREDAPDALREDEMRDLLAVGIHESRARAQRADFHKRVRAVPAGRA